MRKGYALEKFIEDYFLELAGQTREMPLEQRTFRVPFSGAMKCWKGDVLTNIKWLKYQFMVECKERRLKRKKRGVFFNLQKEWLVKLQEESYAVKRIPLFIFSFKGTCFNRLQVMIPFANCSFFDDLSIFVLSDISNGYTINKSELDRLYTVQGYIIYLSNQWILMSWNNFCLLMEYLKKKNINDNNK